MSFSSLPILGAAAAGVGSLASSAAGAVGSAFADFLSPAEEPLATPPPNTAAERAAAALKEFAELARQRLTAAGIDVSQPIELSSDGFDGVQAGDHPQRALIEKLLDDPQLAASFQSLAAQFVHLQASTFRPINSPEIDSPADFSIVLDENDARVTSN